MTGTFNCNFESNTCGWTQAKDDTFDWTRHQGSTASTNTGPSRDHTTGSKYCIACSTVSHFLSSADLFLHSRVVKVLFLHSEFVLISFGLSELNGVLNLPVIRTIAK